MSEGVHSRFSPATRLRRIIARPLHPRLALDALERRLLLTAQAYDWNNVTVHGNGFINGIVYSPAQPNLAYAHTGTGGAYRWDPSTLIWSPLNDWSSYDDPSTQHLGVETLAVDPTDANRVYLATGTNMSATAILRSTDQGRTWLRTDIAGINSDGDGPAKHTGERMVVDPNLPNILYYGTRDDGLWKSADFGETWSNIPAFPAIGEDSGFTQDTGIVWVLLDKNSATFGNPTQTLYAGVAFSAVGVARIYRSTNGGASWSALPGAQPTTANDFPQRAALSTDGSHLFLTYGHSSTSTGPDGITGGRVYRVTDPDLPSPTWSDASPVSPGYGFSGVAIDPAFPGTVYVTELGNYGPADRIWKSTTNGATWTVITPNSHRNDSSSPYASSLVVHRMGDLQIDPFNRDVAIFTTGYGLYRTTDLTTTEPTWTFFNDGLEQSTAMELVSPNTGSVNLLSAITDRDGFRHDNFAVSPSIGRHGQNTGLARGTSDDLDVAWNDGNSAVRTIRVSPWVQYSLDNGVTWSWFTATGASGADADGANIAICADGTKAVYEPAGSGRVRFATRTGSSWSGWTSAGITNQPADGATLVADLVGATTFYAYVGSTVSRSTNGGSTWTVMTTGAPTSPSWVRAVPGQAGHLLASDSDNGLWRTTDGGATWSRMNAGAVTTASHVGVGMAAPGESYPAIFVGGTVNGLTGFHRSDDQGATWTLISDLAHQYGDVTVIQGDPRVYGRLYVGSNGRGILYADIHQTPANLPVGWSTSDIGSPGSAGAAGESSGIFGVTGGGSGFSSTDQFRFAYQQLTGNGSITARVVDVPNGAPGSYTAKAGVMMRDSLASNSVNALVTLAPGSTGGVAFTTRTTSSTNTIATATTGVWPPYWVRLVRAGNQFTAFHSADGVSWTQAGSTQSISMDSTIYVGLAVTAGNDGQVNTSQFTNVAVQADSLPPIATIGIISPNPRSTGVSSFIITFDQPVTGFELTDLTLSRDGDSVSLSGANLNTGDGGTTWTLSDTTDATDEVGSYMLTVVASGSDIINGSSIPMVMSESEGWVMNAINGTGSGDDIRLTRNGTVTDLHLDGVYRYGFNASLLPQLLILGNGGNDLLTLVGDASDESASFSSGTISIWTSISVADIERFAYDGAGGSDDLSINAVRVKNATATADLNTLTITSGGSFDLGVGAAIVHNSDGGSWDGAVYTGLSGLVAQARGDGTWNGTGITSSDVSAGYTTVALARAGSILGIDPTDTALWRGQTVTGTSTLLRYTYDGDANLSGNVDVDDYGQIDFNASVGGVLTGWLNGDFDLSGAQDVDDYGIIDFVAAIQGGPL